MASAYSYLPGSIAAAYYNEANNKFAYSGDLSAAIDSWFGLNATNSATILAENIMDADYNIESVMVDGTTRETAASGFSTDIAVLKQGQVTFSMRWLPAATKTLSAPWSFTDLLVNAWRNNDTIAMVFLDHKTDKGSGGTSNKRHADPSASLPQASPEVTLAPQGLAGHFNVSLSKGEALKDIQKMNVTLNIADQGLWYIADTMTGPSLP